MLARVASLLLVASCGRVGFDPELRATTDAGVDAGPLVCPLKFTMKSTGCYRVVAADVTWLDAQLACEGFAVGAHLAVIDNAEELAVVVSLLGGLIDAWVGASDRVTPGIHLTVTGKPAFTPWGNNEPDAAEDCMELRENEPTKTWDDLCDTPDDYVCEYDGIPSDPTAY